MMSCSNQATGMLSESSGKGIHAVIIGRITKLTELTMNRQRFIKAPCCRVSSLYAQ